MNRVIKDFLKIEKDLQEEIYAAYSEGLLERTNFPFRGEIAEGVIYKGEDVVYLIPKSTLIAGKAGSAKDLDEDDDDDDDDVMDDVDISVGDDDADDTDDEG